ncbi:MAG: response regulator [Methylobacterium sp.]|uniref:response regulator n=1 Tax=Methylobacterium sp. TaxID=409 RepID=UPI0025F88D86|nr:response regulator [Methylobacterium sp.]MBX9930068.1 response regulator [Methylobacterium sp.]
MIPFACAALPWPAVRLAGAHETVLVVEDEAMVCDLAAEAFLDEGYRVLTAADADEAQAILERESIDLLFTDIDLAHNTNGIALARCARRHRPGLPVIYTSGGRANLSPADAVPASVFVPKPYRPSQLVAVANNLLRHA